MPSHKQHNHETNSGTAAPRRICFVNTVPRAYRFFLQPQMAYLAARRYEITFVSSADPALASQLPNGYRFIVVPMRRGFDVFRIPLLIWRFYRLFKNERFDIVQYSGPNAALYASVAALAAGVPVRIYAQWGIRYVGFNGLRRRVLKSVERVICRCSTIVEPDSRSNLAFAVAEGLYSSAKARVIWNGSACGVDLERFDRANALAWRREIRSRHGIAQNAFVIGFVGALRRDKGTNELFEAARALQAEDPTIWLVLVGDKDVYHTVDEQLRRWADSAPRVVYQSPTSDVPKFLAAMDLFVFPSYREGFGTVVVEAAAMGVPSIVTEIPGPTDAVIAGQTGLVVPKGEWRSIVNAVRALQADPDLLRSMSEAACGHASRHFEQQELMDHFYADKEQLAEAAVCVNASRSGRAVPFVSAVKHEHTGSRKPIVVRRFTASDVQGVVAIHTRAFPGYFLTQLGNRFLTLFYDGAATWKDSNNFVAEVDGRVVGFVIGVHDHRAFHRYLRRKYALRAALSVAGPALTRPQVLARMTKAFFSSGPQLPGLTGSLLMSIAVDPIFGGRGIGSSLLHAFNQSMAASGASSYRLTTDRDNNDAVNRFYLSAGFILECSFQTGERRWLNRYVYYLGGHDSQGCHATGA
jgi:glycosyltransferase involved in cell wall biosynthesis/ribosomal protein S18 acetylase RimI-like enzyme